MTTVTLHEQLELPFSIDSYEELVAKNKTHEVRTRNGKSVRVICTDIIGDFPVAGLIKFDLIETLERYNKSGNYYKDGSKHHYDLFIRPIPPKTLYFLNCYERGTVRCNCLRSAEENASPELLFTLEIFEDGSTLRHDAK